ncbi:pantetheine-phosphate adenylyltransferase [Clostridium estertheticum]|uniref:Phosphopantetheine adenylyltransferase n=2 Tax=Clostridium estertheticum TaxID=238834 RepID=A0A1J0GJ48_9CLOT|nr:pantetheine-phosphate adenylyltransferase [Clostridium estertheticum]APC40960.1 pantetheine-phosphate adenylyltransferase [Clostridium estertheticum subsp. estertheticum]MBU3074023.1 pantetheine-phosphate adenylyltransferase [Clostridium estertheticum]MBU3164117.1 pantetheine-phosphate adenylyltransferase [Clostridium estertheticum]MBU3170053.1 pantetheine-phosphate adenylyltransferase [Clostridium estertheticum]MBU3186156.1 pantetheine-phosphate adenylyltransferase [Clostridium esterthetic
MKKAICPGSFDPITNGHLDIIERASKVFNELIVGVVVNPAKKCLFSVDERVAQIKNVVKDLPNVRVEKFSGLLVNLMNKEDARVIVKGLRSVSDFEYEFQMAAMNNKLDPSKETVFMMTKTEYCYISSTSVKQVAMLGGSIKGLVPEEIIPEIIRKFNSK